MFDLEANDEIIHQVEFHLARGEFAHALALLNQVTDYRFTALYHIAGERLHNLLVFDREQGSTTRLDPMPLGESYCDFVNRMRDAFLVQDSQQDSRVVDHPKRPVVHAYCGVPLLGMSGEVFGTLCHFDFNPVPENGATLQWLQATARLFDPRVLAESLARGIQPKVDALEAVARLLEDSLLDAAEARTAFEDYARPVRADASRLPEAVVAATNARIDAILQRMTHAFETRAAADRPTV